MTHYRIQRRDGSWTQAERVTSVIRRGMPRPALEAWKLREVAEYVGAHPQFFGTGKAAVEAWEASRQHVADRGTRVHRILASRLKDIHLPVEGPDAMYLAAFDSWWEACGWTLTDVTHVEQTLLSFDGKVAGTCDLILQNRVMIDWKTAAKPGPAWPDQLVQLGAYASMAWLVEGTKIRRETTPSPTIGEARIVQLCADGQWNETRLSAWPELMKAISTWYAVRQVAEAVGEDSDAR